MADVHSGKGLTVPRNPAMALRQLNARHAGLVREEGLEAVGDSSETDIPTANVTTDSTVSANGSDSAAPSVKHGATDRAADKHTNQPTILQTDKPTTNETDKQTAKQTNSETNKQYYNSVDVMDRQQLGDTPGVVAESDEHVLSPPGRPGRSRGIQPTNEKGDEANKQTAKQTRRPTNSETNKQTNNTTHASRRDGRTLRQRQPMADAAATIVTSFRISAATMEALDEFCFRNRMRKQDAVQHALDAFITEYEDSLDKDT